MARNGHDYLLNTILDAIVESDGFNDAVENCFENDKFGEKVDERIESSVEEAIDKLDLRGYDIDSLQTANEEKMSQIEDLWVAINKLQGRIAELEQKSHEKNFLDKLVSVW